MKLSDGLHPSVVALAGNESPYEGVARCWQYCVPRFERQSSYSKDERVTARPTGPLYKIAVSCNVERVGFFCLFLLSKNYKKVIATGIDIADSTITDNTN